MNFNATLQKIASARNILLSTHLRPDGDAVGSLVALQSFIDQAASSDSTHPVATRLLFLSNVPAHYRFLLKTPPWELSQLTNPQPIDPALLDPYDLIIVVDTNAAFQLPGLADYLLAHPNRTLVIDHHLSSDNLGATQLIDNSAAAAGEIVFQLAQAAHWPLTADAASALFVALSTDTGWFRFANVTPNTLNITAQLVAAGAQPPLIYRLLFQQFPPARLKLLGLVLDSLELFSSDRLAVMHVSRDMLARTGARTGHIENMVNESQQIASVTVSALLVEQDDGSTRVSFRSRGPLDVNIIARQINGGGHAQASGATLQLPLDQARTFIISLLCQALDNPPSNPLAYQ